jgi:hypothetical protein
MFVNFAAGPGEVAARVPAAAASPRRRVGIPPPGDEADDDTFWAEYSERDFQSVYETAHQEEVAEWDQRRLCDEIKALQTRQKELVNLLVRLDPEVYLQKLQAELLSLQETSRKLKSDLCPALPDSSTTEEQTQTENNEQQVQQGSQGEQQQQQLQVQDGDAYSPE